MTGKRPNGEGSIFPRRDGWGAYRWVTLPDGTRTRKYVYGKDIEVVRERWVAMDTETYPEHDKLYPSSQFDPIYEFFEFLAGEGVSDMGWEDVRELIMKWKGVDPLGYAAEGLTLRREYAWLWKRFGVDEPERGEPKLRVTRPVPTPERPTPQEPTGDGLDFLLAKIREGRDT